MKKITRPVISTILWARSFLALTLFLGLLLPLEASGPENLGGLHGKKLTQALLKVSPLNEKDPEIMRWAKWKAKFSSYFFNGRNYYRFNINSNGQFTKINKTCLELCTKKQIQLIILKNLPQVLRDRLQKVLSPTLELASKYQVDPFWALAVMWTESHFDHSEKSPVGAYGFMQIMPATGVYLVNTLTKLGGGVFLNTFHQYNRRPSTLYKDPLINLEMGIFYLKFLEDFFAKNKSLATVAYNMGPFAVQQRLKDGKAVGKNNNYLKKVTWAYKQLAQSFIASSN